MPGDTLIIRARVEGEETTRPRLDLSLEVGPGITVIMGPSGAGKTTLLTTVAGLSHPSSGFISLGESILCDTSKNIFVPPHQRQLALVFQSLALFPHMSVWENVAYGAPQKTDRKSHAIHWLKRAHADHLADRKPATLSGGEAQRVALARALASTPRALLLDEPFTALDAELRTSLADAVIELIKDLKIPTILVTHDQDEAQKYGQTFFTIQSGKIDLQNPPQT